MITGYEDFYYNVRDMKKSIAFYMQSFDMKLTYETEHWSSLQCGNLTLGLHWTEGKDIPLTPRDSHGSFSGGTLILCSNDVIEDRDRISKNGGKILSEADRPWGHMLVFEDIDGNVLKLMNPK